MRSSGERSVLITQRFGEKGRDTFWFNLADGSLYEIYRPPMSSV